MAFSPFVHSQHVKTQSTSKITMKWNKQGWQMWWCEAVNGFFAFVEFMKHECSVSTLKQIWRQHWIRLESLISPSLNFRICSRFLGHVENTEKLSLPSTCTTFLLPFSTSEGREVTERAEVRMKTIKARSFGCFENCPRGHNRESWLSGEEKMRKTDSCLPREQSRLKNTNFRSTKDTKDNS